MPLTDAAVRNAKPAERPFKLSDEKGLFLLIRGCVRQVVQKGDHG